MPMGMVARSDHSMGKVKSAISPSETKCPRRPCVAFSHSSADNPLAGVGRHPFVRLLCPLIWGGGYFLELNLKERALESIGILFSSKNGKKANPLPSFPRSQIYRSVPVVDSKPTFVGTGHF